MSPFCREYFRNNATGAQKSMPKINQGVVSNALIPFCSQPEQKAIVTKVEKLLALCDQLETQITSNQIHAEQLMQAVLKEAFTQTSKTASGKCISHLNNHQMQSSSLSPKVNG